MQNQRNFKHYEEPAIGSSSCLLNGTGSEWEDNCPQASRGCVPNADGQDASSSSCGMGNTQKSPIFERFDSDDCRQRFVPMDDLMPLFLEQLNAGKSVKFSPRGVSMLPMLRQGIDSVIISPASDCLQRYDIPLYRRDSGAYVLHRVVKVGGAPAAPVYTCIGDNQFVLERGIRHDQVIAVVTGFCRADKACSINGLVYKLYCRLWCGSRGARRFCKRCVRFAKRKLHIR